jgi:XTP/dITP diphosphohydrolase
MSIPRLREGDRLVLATHNAGKLKEFQELFEPFGLELTSAGELDLPEPEETGTTFAENARIKAHAAAQASGMLALSDDSGLCVDALNGDPGVYTADWAGVPRDFKRAMKRVEDALQAANATSPSQRKGSFNATLCLAHPDGRDVIYHGQCFGTLDPAGLQLDLGLVERFELVCPEPREDLVQRERRCAGPWLFRIGFGAPMEGNEFRQPSLRKRLLDDAEQAHAIRRTHRLDGVEQRTLQAAGDDQRGADACLAQMPDEGHAVHAGHVDVGHDDVERLIQLAHDLHRRAAIIRFVDPFCAEQFEDPHDHAALELVVLRHQEAQPFGREGIPAERGRIIVERRDMH